MPGPVLGMSNSNAARLRKVIERDGPICAICKEREATDLDHIWPRVLGGSDHPYNLQAVCDHCGSVKWMRPPDVLPLYVDGDHDPWDRFTELERRRWARSAAARLIRTRNCADRKA